MILVTNTAVKCGGLHHWIHASHIKRAKATDEEVVTQITDSQGQAQVRYMDPEGGEQREEHQHQNI